MVCHRQKVFLIIEVHIIFSGECTKKGGSHT